MPPIGTFLTLGLHEAHCILALACLLWNLFFLNQQFITWDLMVDHGSYIRSLLKLEEKKGKGKEKR